MIIIDMNSLVAPIVFGLTDPMLSTFNIDVARVSVIQALLSVHKSAALYKTTPTTLVYDSGGNWRYDVFPGYKHSRRKDTTSTLDKQKYVQLLKELESDLPEAINAITMKIDKTEGDDVIGTLAIEWDMKNNLCVVSKDSDFHQMAGYLPYAFCIMGNSSGAGQMTCYQYITDLSIENLHKKFFTGDPTDGIPNVLSDLDIFVKKDSNPKLRQKPLRESTIKEWTQEILKNNKNDSILSTLLDSKTYERYEMNKKLMDFRCTPRHIKVEILTEFYNKTLKHKPYNRSAFKNYCDKYNMYGMFSNVDTGVFG